MLVKKCGPVCPIKDPRCELQVLGCIYSRNRAHCHIVSDEDESLNDARYVCQPGQVSCESDRLSENKIDIVLRVRSAARISNFELQ